MAKNNPPTSGDGMTAQDFAASLTPTPTQLICSGVLALSAGASLVFSNSGTRAVRRCAIITNYDSTNQVQIYDGAGNCGGAVFPQSQFILETDDDFQIRNVTGATVNIAVMELNLTQEVANAAKAVGKVTRK